MPSPAFIIDVSSLSLTAEEKLVLAQPAVAGVILFSRNYQDKAQLKNLTSQIHNINPNLLISVDHEGGEVQRFREGFTPLPAMAKLGDIYQSNQKVALDLAYACGFVLAYELSEVGVDFSFAPVVDIDYGHNTVIASRAFSSKAKVIIALASRLIDGTKQVGMASVIKHFPGHGFVDMDSHLGLPTDSRTLRQMQDDLSTFIALLPKAEAVMPAHIIYQQLDDKPAGFSKFWLQDMLRKTYHYQGVIISDDLSMQGAAYFSPNIDDRVDYALKAGCDLALVCTPKELVEVCTQKELVKKVPSLYRPHSRYRSPDKVKALKAKPKLDKIGYQNCLNKIKPIL